MQKYAKFAKKTPKWQNVPFPSTELTQIFCVQPQTPPRSNSKSWQMGNFWPKNIGQARDALGHNDFKIYLLLMPKYVVCFSYHL